MIFIANLKTFLCLQNFPVISDRWKMEIGFISFRLHTKYYRNTGRWNTSVDSLFIKLLQNISDKLTLTEFFKYGLHLLRLKINVDGKRRDWQLPLYPDETQRKICQIFSILNFFPLSKMLRNSIFEFEACISFSVTTECY